MKKFASAKAQKQQGFTLIELSIVLVIIGLIVGGVLVGQDLIKAAEIRATVSQIEKYNAAANTFRSKYNALPGDLPSPANFGMTATTAAASWNGDSLIQSCTQNDGMKYSCETAAFWNHLSTAGLIAENIALTSTTAANGTVTTFGSTYAPAAKAGAGAYVLVGAPGSADTVSGGYVSTGYNYFFINGPLSATASVLTAYNPLTPTQAYQIDSKLDDGIPTTGVVVAFDNNAIAGSNTVGTGVAFALATGLKLKSATASVCQTNGSATYNIASAGTTQLCSLAMRGSF